MKTFTLLVAFMLLRLSVSNGQSANFTAAQKQATTDAGVLGAKYSPIRNAYIDSKNVIHIFMFEDGNFLLSGYPTTATDRDKFQVHLYTTNADSYVFEFSGNYEPTLLAEDSAPTSSFAGGSPIIVPLSFAVVGPFTNTATFTVKHSSTGTTYNTLSSTTVKISKRAFVSIGSGFFYSPLKNPSNIHGARRYTGDSTLVADNVHGYAALAIMATFYPGGRNSLMMPRSWWQDRFGIMLGTNIASTTTNFKNVLIGTSYDFAYGGSVVAGINIDTQRQRIIDVDYHNFTFGQTTYKGQVAPRLYKEVAYSVFLGVQVDSRIFTKLFPTK